MSATPRTDALVCQRTIDRIVARAQNSAIGLGNPEKDRAYDLSRYSPSLESIAILLVGAHFEKYDLVALLHAVMEEFSEHSSQLETELTATAKRLAGALEGCALRLRDVLAEKASEVDLSCDKSAPSALDNLKSVAQAMKEAREKGLL